LDGTYKRDYRAQNGTFSPTGRIKFGTESNGGFKNITVTNCVFDYSRGLALEAVDGALLEDVTISNITMRDISNSPIFIRLGARNRGPKETTRTGAIRRVVISNVVVFNADPRYSSIISGIPGFAIEDVSLQNIRIYSQGGGTKEQAGLEPPEKEDTYPEPTMFGDLPSYGFFVRHVKRLQLRDVQVSFLKSDLRPAFWLNNVADAEFFQVKARSESNAPSFLLKNVSNFALQQSWPFPDQRLEKVELKKF
jgi:polygalacturonase